MVAGQHTAFCLYIAKAISQPENPTFCARRARERRTRGAGAVQVERKAAGAVRGWRLRQPEDGHESLCHRPCHFRRRRPERCICGRSSETRCRSLVDQHKGDGVSYFDAKVRMEQYFRVDH